MDNLRRFVIVFTAVIFLTLAVCGFILAFVPSKFAPSMLTYEKSASDKSKPFRFVPRKDLLFTICGSIMAFVPSKFASSISAPLK